MHFVFSVDTERRRRQSTKMGIFCFSSACVHCVRQIFLLLLGERDKMKKKGKNGRCSVQMMCAVGKENCIRKRKFNRKLLRRD